MTNEQKKLFQLLKQQHDDLASATPVNVNESGPAKRARMKRLEQHPEEWFAYYFPKYAKFPPADFHIAAAKRVIEHPEWVEVRNWSRELAKSTRTMMEVMYLVLTKRKFNVLCISNSKDNADRLLLPYQVNFEKNARIIHDYGVQENLGSWSQGEFITRQGAAFRALGAGQSPRGTRNEAIRPDVIIFDDLDTDEDCRNADIIEKNWAWVQEAVIPTRSISSPLLVIWCGNVIAEDCCVLRAREFADHVDVVNIRNADGLSSWPQKNSEEDIDRVLATISYASAQKEYFNNPMSTGKAFPEITWASCPPWHEFQFLVVYADPATSNKDKPGQSSKLSNSRKAVFIVGHKDAKYHILYGFLDVMSNDNFIRSFYTCKATIDNMNKNRPPGYAEVPAYYYVENNTLQDPFYEQVLLPLIYSYAADYNGQLPIIPDARSKPEKWFRIEAQLEPLNRTGRLIFNVNEKDNPHMKRLAAQFKAARPTSKELDGPDCIEGAIWIINNKINIISPGDTIIIPRRQNSKRF